MMLEKKLDKMAVTFQSDAIFSPKESERLSSNIQKVRKDARKWHSGGL